MKTFKKLTALVLIGTMILSATACGASKKKVSAKEFKKAFEKEDFTVQESEDDDAEECWIAYDEDYASFISYYEFEDKDEAKECWEDSYADLKDAKDDEEFDGKLTKNSWKFSAKGEFEDCDFMDDGEYYLVGILAEETVIIVMAEDDDDIVEAIDSALKALGY